jgi:hypothetical protein
MTHVMADIETICKRPGGVVLSVALVRFSDEAHTTFNISIPDQQQVGLTVDPETHAWWGEQEAKHPGAWAAATSNPIPLRAALEHISTWLAWATGGADWLIWCHGATFDAPILEALYLAAGIECPWKFWQVRCTRTLYNLAGINNKDYAVPPPHIALNDAIGQTRAANAALGVLSRAHVKPVFRYFHHPESGSVFFIDDGSHPADRGGIDAGHCEEISGPQYAELQIRYGADSK